MRDQVGNWAAEHHPEELATLMRAWIGPHDPTEETVHQALGFALLARHGGPSLADRYDAAGHRHHRAERQVLEGWRSGRFH
jgi:hypothetical protein